MVFFFKDFLMWTIFQVFIEFVTILLLFYVLVFWPRGMWDLSSPTRDQTLTPSIGRQSLNHWTTSGSPYNLLFDVFSFSSNPVSCTGCNIVLNEYMLKERKKNEETEEKRKERERKKERKERKEGGRKEGGHLTLQLTFNTICHLRDPIQRRCVIFHVG